MVIDYCESGTGATTCWHSCSLCRTVRLTSEPGTGAADDLSAKAARGEDEGAYGGEPSPSATGTDLDP